MRYGHGLGVKRASMIIEEKVQKAHALSLKRRRINIASLLFIEARKGSGYKILIKLFLSDVV